MFQESKNKILQQAIRSEVFKLPVKSAFNHIIITDVEGVVIYANSAVERITGYSHDEIIGSTPRLWGQQMTQDFYKKLWHIIKIDKKAFAGEITNKRKNGELYIARAIISPILDNENNLIGFIGTEEDITQKKEAEKMKTEFISITAHQLKTPMTSVKWSIELLRDLLKDSSSQVKEQIEFIANANSELISLVDELLNISRLETGRLVVDPIKMSIKSVLDSVIDKFRLQIEQKRIELKITEVLEDEVLIDKAILKEIIVNLLSNAIKYSPEETSIIISFYYNSEGNIEFRIRDSGYGIPNNEQAYVFDKHHRCQNVIEKQIEGTGLGLYFVKKAVEMSGGEIWFESNVENGTTFWFTIPKNGMAHKDGEVKLS